MEKTKEEPSDLAVMLAHIRLMDKEDKIKTRKQYLNNEKSIYVIHSKKWTEIDIHWRIYLRLFILAGELGCEAKNEVTISIGGKASRIDIMIFKNKKPVCGVEVKKQSYSTNPGHDKKQLTIYQEFTNLTGIPIYYCKGFDDIKKISSMVYEYLRENIGQNNLLPNDQ